MARVKYFDPNTGKWEYADSCFAVGGNDYGGNVAYDEVQNLTDEQKAQARENIGAQPAGNYLTKVPEGYAKTEDVPTDAEIIQLIKDNAPESSGGGISVTGAKVGQTVKISAVDENGVPTAWEPTDFPGGGTGADGRGIVSITRTSGDGTPGTTDTYTIIYTDNTTSIFTVTNGKIGPIGPMGQRGPMGPMGPEGPVGRGISFISLVGSSGSSSTTGVVDTYKIQYTDGTFDSFTVRNGKDGKDGSTTEVEQREPQVFQTTSFDLLPTTDVYIGDFGIVKTQIVDGKDSHTAFIYTENGWAALGGDLSGDIVRLEQLINDKASTDYVNQELNKKANSDNVYSKKEVETYVAQQIASAEHLKRVIVEQLPNISIAQANTIYMIKKTGGGIASWGKNIYEEYMVIEGEWELLGNSQVDLTDYAKTDYVDNKTKDKADKATTLEGYGITDAFTKDETYSRTEISELIGQITGGESAADVLAKLNEYTGTNNERVGKVEGRVETLEKAGYQANVIEGIKLADAANALTLDNKIATIPAAEASQYGLVKLSSEIGVNTAGALEVKALNLSKITQDEEDWLILDGGTSTT